MHQVIYLLEKGVWPGNKAKPEWVRKIEEKRGHISENSHEFLVHILVPAMWDEIIACHKKLDSFEIKEALVKYMNLDVDSEEEQEDENI